MEQQTQRHSLFFFFVDSHFSAGQNSVAFKDAEGSLCLQNPHLDYALSQNSLLRVLTNYFSISQRGHNTAPDPFYVTVLTTTTCTWTSYYTSTAHCSYSKGTIFE